MWCEGSELDASWAVVRREGGRGVAGVNFREGGRPEAGEGFYVVGRRPERALGALYEVKGEEGDPIQR